MKKTFPIIDIHTHPVLADFSAGDIDICLRSAGSFGVSIMCVLGNVVRYGDNPPVNGIKAINDESIRIVKKYPEVFEGFCFLNPGHDKNFNRNEIDRCVRGEGFRGIKLWLPVKASDKRLDHIMRKAIEHNIPVLQHTWYKSTGNRPGESTPSDVACLARRFPEANIIMGHMGGCGIRGIIDIEKYPNVYVETGGSQPVSGLVEFAVKRLGPGRVLFGSDIPCRDFSCQLGRIYGAKIKKAEKEMILGKNSAKLLGLTC